MFKCGLDPPGAGHLGSMLTGCENKTIDVTLEKLSFDETP